MKSALVVGAYGGLGAALVTSLKQNGCDVTCAGRRVVRDGESRHVLFDVATDAYPAELKRIIFDTIVYCVGIYPDDPRQPAGPNYSIIDVPLSMLEETIRVNAMGALKVAQATLPSLLKSTCESRLVLVSSGMGRLFEIRSDSFAYRVSKLVLNAIVLAIDDELRKIDLPNLSVFLVCPGWIRTKMGGLRAEKSATVAASEIVELIKMPAQQTRGRFFRGKNELSFTAK